jgi:protein-disulfide isomerase-like protein with CxxC motif
MVVDVIEFTDPGCSWAWGSEPKLRRLRWRHGERLRWRRVMGGLVGDMRNYLEVFDPVQAAPGFVRYWAAVAATTRMPHPVHLRWMYRSTEPACLAATAAALQGEDIEDRVLRRLREATFVFGEPPDTLDRILGAVRAVTGLDLERFSVDWSGERARQAFRADWAETRAPSTYVLNLQEDGEGAGRAKYNEGHWRYVFPTLVFRGPRGERTVPGWKPYERYEEALETVAPGVTSNPRRDPTAEEAFVAWAALAPRELEILCGPDARPPSGVAEFDWGDGVYWLTAPEAEARGIG